MGERVRQVKSEVGSCKLHFGRGDAVGVLAIPRGFQLEIATYDLTYDFLMRLPWRNVTVFCIFAENK